MGMIQGDQRGYMAVKLDFTPKEAEYIANAIVDAIFPEPSKENHLDWDGFHKIR